MPRKNLKPRAAASRKLLVATVGLATVNLALGGACGGKTHHSSGFSDTDEVDSAPPPTSGNLMGPPTDGPPYVEGPAREADAADDGDAADAEASPDADAEDGG